jgi:cytochrome b involved in lipid metabolism
VKRSGPGQDATVGFRGSQHISTVEDQIKQYLIGHIQEYALAEIAKHNTKEDCWIILNHKVCFALHF